MPGMNQRFMIPDALSLEYKRNYGCAFGEIELSDIVNYPPLASEFSRLGLRPPEEFLDFICKNARAFRDDTSDASLIRFKSV